MNIIDKNKYSEFNHILSGCRTILDAHQFAEIYVRKNPEMRSLIYSMVNGKRYEPVIDFKTMEMLLENINECQYLDDAETLSNLYSKRTFDSTQKNSLYKIAKNKPNKIKHMMQSPSNEVINLIEKKCPHCGHSYKTNISSIYTICGYVDTKTGFDHEGCGKDWCLKCEKKLCKSWYQNQLFLEMNRYHDNDCCRQFAAQHGDNYLEEYCFCNNQYVKRCFVEQSI